MEPPKDNHTEQWLQAYARQRRERAGEAEEMHDVTRRMLLDEAQREWGAEAKAEEPAVEESPWVRWAWAVTVTAAVIFVFTILRMDRANPNSPGGAMKVAQNKQPVPAVRDPLADREQDPGESTEEAKPQENLNKNRKAPVNRRVTEPLPLPIAPAPKTARGVAPAIPPAASSPKPQNSAPAGGLNAGAGFASTADAFKSKLPKSPRDDFYAGPSNLQQNFSRNPNQAGLTRNAPPVPEAKAAEMVLRNFKFERNGSAVRVVDQDGSVYLGQARMEPARARATGKRDKDKKKELGLLKTNAPSVSPTVSTLSSKVPGRAPQMFYFSVIGTNLTLKQRVVFKGNFENERFKPAVKAVAPAKQKPADTKADVAPPVPAPQLRIQGRAQVGRLSYGVDARNQKIPAPTKAGERPRR